MKTLIFLALLIAMFSFTATAEDWSAHDKEREGVFLALHAIDWAQTRNIARDPQRWQETNAMLGRNPSMGKVNAYFVGYAIVHLVIADVLPNGWRQGFQYVTIGETASAVAHNFSIGLSAKF